MMRAGISLNFFSLTIREMSRSDGCYVILLKALSWGARGLSVKIFIRSVNMAWKAPTCVASRSWLSCFASPATSFVVSIFIEILVGLWAIKILFGFSMMHKKGIFQRTRSPADVVFANSIMERASLGSEPAFRIFLRALRVAKRQFVYTALVHKWSASLRIGDVSRSREVGLTTAKAEIKCNVDEAVTRNDHLSHEIKSVQVSQLKKRTREER